MSRALTSGLISKINEQFGADPINIVEIQWVSGGTRVSYADRDIPTQNIRGRILELSNLDFVINIDDGSDSAEISIKLSDVDGALKNIIDNNDIHKREVWVYQWFQGMNYADRSLVFQGTINSPITWVEGDRVLSFNVVSRIEDAEIGFSIEEGQFNGIQPDLIGQPWPLKFGTTLNVPALQFTSPMRGTLSTGVGIHDFTLPYRINLATRIECAANEYQGQAAINTGSLNFQPSYGADINCLQTNCIRLQKLQHQLTEQRKYEYEKIVIIGGERFPQGVPIVLNIDGGLFHGKFVGTPDKPSTTFEITKRVHPDYEEIGDLNDAVVTSIINEKNNKATAAGCKNLKSKIYKPKITILDLFNFTPTSKFFWASSGSEVTLAEGEPTVYVSNLVPENVLRVSAFRRLRRGRVLITVPPSYYTVRTTNFVSYTTTEIVFNKRLNLIDDTWDDDIYITSVSSVGPNTVDILTWLINKYTNLAIDTVSFNHVKSRLENYPSDFPLLERKNILEVLREIAFQCRCSIYLRDRKFYLKYLSERPNSVTTITDSDVDAGSLEITHTNTEDLVTKFVAEWKRDYSVENPDKLILRNNIKKYGTQEGVFDFYIYNEFEYVKKSAIFWLIRKSNTWKHVRFSTTLNKLMLETFDGCTLNLPDFVDNPVLTVVKQADYDSANKQLNFDVWTPVRSGELTEYPFALPADISTTLYWPTDEELATGLYGSGDSPGSQVKPPSNHVLNWNINGYYDSHDDPADNRDTPSDLDDEKVIKNFEGGVPPDVGDYDDGEINIEDLEDPKFEDPYPNDNVDMGGGGVRFNQDKDEEEKKNESQNKEQEEKDKDKKWPIPDPEELDASACKHRVEIFVHFTTLTYRKDESGFPSPGRLGASRVIRRDTIYTSTWCEARQLALAVGERHKAMQEAESYGRYTIHPISAVAIRDTRPSCSQDDCERRQLDEEGKLIGYYPVPIASESRPEPGESIINPETEEPVPTNGTPDDYFESLEPYIDPGVCNEKICPGDELDPNTGKPMYPAPAPAPAEEG